MRTFNIALLSTYLILNSWVPLQAEDPVWQIYTDNIPPFTYVNKQGKHDGVIYHLIREALEETDIKFKLNQMPWSRALAEYKNNSTAFIYPITRTMKREDDYQWLLPVYSHSLMLYAYKPRFKNKDIRVDKENHRFLCVGITIGCELLRDKDIPNSSIDTISSINVSQILTMLSKQRVDFAYIPDSEFDYTITSLGLNKDDFVEIRSFREELIDYLVTHPSHKSAQIKRLKELSM